MDDSHLAETGAMCFPYILLNNDSDFLWDKCVEVDRVLDRDAHGFRKGILIHDPSI